MDDNPYNPGTLYEAELKPRSKNWLIRAAAGAFLLSILSMVITQACLTWSFVEQTDLEGRIRIASYPMKVAILLCLLGFVLLIAGLVFRRRASEQED